MKAFLLGAWPMFRGYVSFRANKHKKPIKMSIQVCQRSCEKNQNLTTEVWKFLSKRIIKRIITWQAWQVEVNDDVSIVFYSIIGIILPFLFDSICRLFQLYQLFDACSQQNVRNQETCQSRLVSRRYIKGSAKMILQDTRKSISHRIHGTGIFTFIYLKDWPNVAIDVPYMDPMGI